MQSNELKMIYDALSALDETPSAPMPLERVHTAFSLYDPELLYVECRFCGKPVLWEQGKTTELLLQAGVDLHTLDERCLIMSEGCPQCCPEEPHGFTMAVVRVAGLTPEEAVLMSRPAGSA